MSHRILFIFMSIFYWLSTVSAVGADDGSFGQKNRIELVAPILMESMIFMPKISPLESSGIALYSNISWIEKTGEIDMSEIDIGEIGDKWYSMRNIIFSLVGKYRVGKLVFGFGLPLSVSFSRYHNDNHFMFGGRYKSYNSYSVGSLRLNAGYVAFGGNIEGMFLSFSLGVTFPSNRFPSEPIGHSWFSWSGFQKYETAGRFTVLQTSVSTGYAGNYFSIYGILSPSFILKNDDDDCIIGNASVVIGLKPFWFLREFSFVLQTDVLVEISGTTRYLSDNHSKFYPLEKQMPISISYGGRYEIGSWFVELTGQTALHDNGYYLGDHSVGFGMGYQFKSKRPSS